jgi:hypothetical protein
MERKIAETNKMNQDQDDNQIIKSIEVNSYFPSHLN